LFQKFSFNMEAKREKIVALLHAEKPFRTS
jgi:hypothetical protein